MRSDRYEHPSWARELLDKREREDGRCRSDMDRIVRAFVAPSRLTSNGGN